MGIRLFALRIRWLVLLALLGLALIAAPTPTDVAAVRAFQQGEELARQAVCLGEWNPGSLKVERAYQYAARRRSLDSQPWQALGTYYLAKFRPDDALWAYNQAIQRGGPRAVSTRYLAKLYAMLGDYAQSIDYWTKHLVRHPNDQAAHLTVAQIAILRFDWQRARSELEHLLSDAPDDPLVNAWLGLLLLEENPALGQAYLQRASANSALTRPLQPVFDAGRALVTREASDDPAYRSALLGVALLQIDDTAPLSNATSLQDLCAGSKSQPTLLDAQSDLIIQRQALSALALRSLLEATYQNPAYAEAYAYLGQTLDRVGRPALAWTTLETALQLAPRSPLVLMLVGLYWDHHDAPALARHYYQQAYQQEPHNAALCLEIAGTYATEGQYTAAEVWLLLATKIAPQDTEIWKTVAHFYLDAGIGVQESGLPAAAQLLRIAPNDPAAHDLLGWAYFLAQEDAEAEVNFDRALALDPTLASAHYHLGRLRSRQGRFDEAALAYRRAHSYDWDGHLASELERAWSELPQAYRQ